MTIPYGNMEEITKNNDLYRRVITTQKNMQLVIMSLKPLEEIGSETHQSITQFIRIEEGRVKAIVNGSSVFLNEDDFIVIPSGQEHNIINISSSKKAKLYTVYSFADKPEHPHDCVQRNKGDKCEIKGKSH